MPKDRIQFKSFEGGVNLLDDPRDLAENQCQSMQGWHAVPGRVLPMLGYSIFNASAIAGGVPVVSLHRLQFLNGNRYKVAGVNSRTYVSNDAGGTFSEMTGPALAANLTSQVTFRNKWFGCNGTADAVQVSTDAVTRANLAVGGGGVARTGSGLGVYDARLWIGSGQEIYYSNALDETVFPSGNLLYLNFLAGEEFLAFARVGVPDAKIDRFGVFLVITNVTAYVVAGAGTTNSPYRLDPIGGGGGVSRATVVGGRRGAFWLGKDGDNIGVYWYTPGAGIVLASKYIESKLNAIPAALRVNACAALHKGFYKLFYTPSGGSTNSEAFWLNVDRIYEDEEGNVGPWFGPRKNMPIRSVCVQDGPGDDGALIGGDTLAGTVYTMESGFSDPGAVAISRELWTREEDAGTDQIKTFFRTMVESFGSAGTANLDVYIDGAFWKTIPITLSPAGDVYDTALFDTATFASESAFVAKASINRRGHRISLKFRYSVSSDVYLNQIQVEAIPRRQSYLSTGR